MKKVLFDTSVWVEYFRKGDLKLRIALQQDTVCIHDTIIAELSLGNLKNRAQIIKMLETLPKLPWVSHKELSQLIEQKQLFGTGLSYVDVQLLACCVKTATPLISYDKKLAKEYSMLNS